MLGLFDSGLGGLTVVRRVRELLPVHDLLFFADQAHVPYGNREPGDLHRLLEHNLTWLDAQGVDAIIMACNTSCAMGDRFGWPPVRAALLDLIESAAMAVERAGYKRMGVVATLATARSGVYAKKIKERVSGAHVFELPAPALVPLVEAGKLTGEEPRAAVAAVCAELPRNIDAVLLACTHYPILDAHFEAALGAGVDRLDPAVAQAERTVKLVERLSLAPGSGRLECVTNGDLDAFHAGVRQLLGDLSPESRLLQPIES